MNIYTNTLEIFKQNEYTPTDIGLLSNNAYLSIVVTNKCQRNCFYCINSETDCLSALPLDKGIDNIRKLVDKYKIKEVIILGGEPLLYPYLYQLIEELKNLKLITRLTTNGIQLLKHTENLIKSGIDGINISFHNEDFIKFYELEKAYRKFKRNKIKVRINTNIWRGNHDDPIKCIDFLNKLSNYGDEIRVSNLIPKDSFSVNSTNDKNLDKKILSVKEYNLFFKKLVGKYVEMFNISPIINEKTLGFVKYVLLSLKTPIIINWNTSSTVAEQVCENDIKNRKINTFKCLVSGDISLSWNFNNILTLS